MIKVRGYQKKAVKKYMKGLKQNINPLICSATGTGKTLISILIMKKLYKKNHRVLFLAGNEEMIDNPYTLSKQYLPRNSTGLLCAALQTFDTDEQILFATIGTIINRLDDVGDFTHIYVDEADNINIDLMSQYQRLIAHYPDASVGGCTATPYWMRDVIYKNGSPDDDKKIFDKKVFHYTFVDAVNDKYLTRPVVASKKGINSDKLKTIAGEYSVESQETQALDRALAKSIWREVYSCAVNQKSNYVGLFCVSVAHAELMAELCPFEFVLVTGQKSKQMSINRKLAVAWGQEKHKKTKCVINVGVFTRGTDMPSMDYAVIARSMQSRRLLEQIVGRPARLFPDKEVFHISDFGDNFKRFGPMENWSNEIILNPKQKRFFHCAQCNELNSVYARKCSNCLKQFQPEPSKTCPLCDTEQSPSSKKCDCGYVFANLRTSAYSGDIIKSEGSDIKLVNSAIITSNKIEYYIYAKDGQQYRHVCRWRNRKPTADTIDFLEALFSIDYSDTKSAHDYLRQKRIDNPQRANKIVIQMGKLKSLWRED